MLDGRGDRARLDEAQILVSQSWGLRFEGREVVPNGATLGAYRATQQWLEQHGHASFACGRSKGSR